MSGVFKGGASEQALRSSSSAATNQGMRFMRLSRCHSNGCRARNANRGASADSIGRVFDHAVIRRETRGEFNSRAQVAFDRHGLEAYAVVGVHGCDGKSLRVENQRARGHAEYLRGGIDLQLNA